MKINFLYAHLPCVSVTLQNKNQSLQLNRVLVDTGSASTLFSTDLLSKIDLVPHPEDQVKRIFGVGGSEVVILKSIDSIQIEQTELKHFEIQIGDMNYGIELDGILGVNFLKSTQAIIDFQSMSLCFP